MHSKVIISSLIAVLSAAPQTWAHSLIDSAVGDAGAGRSRGLGVDDTTPRDGTRRNPFQQDSTIFRNQRSVAQAQGCGTTLQGGANNVNNLVGAMAQAGSIAQVRPGGTLNISMRQINADGAGPYTCMIDATGTGGSFSEITVTQNVPGRNGRDRQGEMTVHSMAVQMPAGMQCTGSMGGLQNLCMVRCQNAARNGPFGGCVPVQMVDPNANANPVQPAPVVGGVPAPVSSIIPAPSGVNGGNFNNGNNNGGNNGQNNGGNQGGNFNNGNNNGGNNGQNNGGNNGQNNGGNFDNGNNNGGNNGGNFNNGNNNGGNNGGNFNNGNNNGGNNGQNGGNNGQNGGNNGQNGGNNGQNGGNNGQNGGNNGQNGGNQGGNFQRQKRWLWAGRLSA